MTEEPKGAPTSDADAEDLGDFDPRFVGLVNLLGQMSAQLLQDKRTAEARGLIDGLSSLEEKTKGNLEPTEAQHLESILYQLRMAAVTAEASDGEGGDDSDADS